MLRSRFQSLPGAFNANLVPCERPLRKGFSLIFYLQKTGEASMRDSVVLLLQDLLEVVTRDMMVNEIR